MATLLSSGRDRISEVPNDILLSILSLMAMKEAAKTSILSKRWRYLWAKRTHLDFDHLIILPERKSMYYTVAEESKYINWVDQVVSLHCGPCIDTFRVFFPIYNVGADHIDKWVRFALLKNVKNLQLELRSFNPVNTVALGFNPLVSLSLVSLHLANVDVGGDFLEYLLSQCRLLECLYVEYSSTLVRLKVVSSKLKRLKLSFCSNLKEIEIEAAVNLIYFEFYSVEKQNANLVFKSVPLLVEASFGGPIVFASSFFHKHPHVCSQISKLFLELGLLEEIPAVVFPTFGNVRQLTLELTGEMEIDLVGITHVLEACPVVHELKLEIIWPNDCLEMEAFKLRRPGVFIKNDVQIQGRSPHPNLKVLHVVGFIGCNVDVDLILYVVGLAHNLETIICDSNRCIYDPNPQIIEASRSRAGKLVKIIPPKINVVIL